MAEVFIDGYTSSTTTTTDEPAEVVVEHSSEESQASAEAPPAKQKVKFDGPGQQERLIELLKAAKSEAAKELRREHAQLKADYALLQQRTQATPPSQDTALELASTRAELQALKSQQAETEKRNALLAAVSGQNFYDTQLAADLLSQSARVVNGKLVFLDSDGNEELGQNLAPLSAPEAARRLAAARPYLIRGAVKGGTGSSIAQDPTPGGPRLEDLFGSKSNGGAANALALHDPQRYRELRRRAVAKGLMAR